MKLNDILEVLSPKTVITIQQDSIESNDQSKDALYEGFAIYSAVAGYLFDFVEQVEATSNDEMTIVLKNQKDFKEEEL